MTQTLSVTDARKDFLKLVDSVGKKFNRVNLTKKGKIRATIISSDYLDSLEETLDILSDKKLMEDIRQGEKEIAEGKGIPLEEVEKELGW